MEFGGKAVLLTLAGHPQPWWSTTAAAAGVGCWVGGERGKQRRSRDGPNVKRNNGDLVCGSGFSSNFCTISPVLLEARRVRSWKDVDEQQTCQRNRRQQGCHPSQRTRKPGL